MVIKISDPLVFSAKTVSTLWEKPEFSFNLTFTRIPSSWNEESPEKPAKIAFSGVKKAFLRLKTRKCMLCDVMLIAHQRVHVLQVMATAARGCGCLTGFSCLFQFFEL